jgi:hypothetical protein
LQATADFAARTRITAGPKALRPGANESAIIIDRDQARAKVRAHSRGNGNERLPPSERMIVLLDPFEDEGFLHR